jgi:hypothetical protein
VHRSHNGVEERWQELEATPSLKFTTLFVKPYEAE